MNTEECLICKAPLEYLLQDEEMECAVCHRREPSKTRCVNGHYVCSDCHTQGMDSIFGLCLAETSADPIAILRQDDGPPLLPHARPGAPCDGGGGPAHRIQKCRRHIWCWRRPWGRCTAGAKEVPGGACGFWGACGAGISAGQFLAIATESTPLAVEPWGLSNQMTARALDSIGKVGGPPVL